MPHALPAVTAFLLGLALVAPALAQECTPTTTTADVCSFMLRPATGCLSGDVAGTVYVDNANCLPIVDELAACAWDLWIYAESNGIPGLQRDDPFVDDTCGGAIAPDTLVL